MVQRARSSTPFPYTTLFRSDPARVAARRAGADRAVLLAAQPDADPDGDPRRAAGVEGDPLSRRQRSEEHTSELQSQSKLVCRLLLEKKKKLTVRALLYSRTL